jgi:hypothetical protein
MIVRRSLKAAARPAIGRATSSSANPPGLCSSCMSVSHGSRRARKGCSNPLLLTSLRFAPKSRAASDEWPSPCISRDRCWQLSALDALNVALRNPISPARSNCKTRIWGRLIFQPPVYCYELCSPLFAVRRVYLMTPNVRPPRIYARCVSLRRGDPRK